MHSFLRVLLIIALAGGTWLNTFAQVHIGGNDYPTLKAAVDAATAGQTITIDADAVINEASQIQITQDGLTISGTDVNTSIINYSGSAHFIVIKADNVTIENLTFDGSSSTNGYGFDLTSPEYNGTNLRNLIVKNFKKTGININGIVGIFLEDIQSLNNGGAGIFMTDVKGANLSNITTSGNPWGGLAIGTKGQYYPIGVEEVIISGTNSFGESSDKNGGMYFEMFNFKPTDDPTITFSTDLVDNANVTFQLDDFGYALHMKPSSQAGVNEDGDSLFYDMIRFYDTKENVDAAIAEGPEHYVPSTSYLVNLSDNNIIVTPDQDLQFVIDAASPGDTIVVESGTFGDIVLDKEGIVITGQAPALAKGINAGKIAVVPGPTVGSINIAANNVTVSYFNLNNPGGAGIFNSIPVTNLTLDYIAADGTSDQGGIFDDVTTLSISNSTFDNSANSDGLVIKNSSDITLNTVSADGNSRDGIVLELVTNVNATDLAGTNNGRYGLNLGESSLLSFTNGTFDGNLDGMHIHPHFDSDVDADDKITDLEFTGVWSISGNSKRGIVLMTDGTVVGSANDTYIEDPVFNGDITLAANDTGAVNILGNVSNPSFEGLTLQGSSYGFAIHGLDGSTSQPSGVNIHNSTFDGYGNSWADYAISLSYFDGRFSTNDVDATYNVWTGNPVYPVVEDIVYDKNDDAALGLVILGIPTLSYPPNGTTGHPLKPRLEWNAFAGAVAYEIQIDTDGMYGSPDTYEVSAAYLYFDVPDNLLNGTTYYWRVRAKETLLPSYSSWSSTWRFTTTTSGISGISYPVPVYPVNSVKVYVSNPLLSWSWSTSQNGITFVEIEYKKGDDDFSTGTIFSTTAASPFLTQAQISNLDAGSDYYWRARSYNAALNLYSAWSATAHFQTDESVSGAPTKPKTLYPKDNVIVYHDDTPLLHWYVTSFDLDLRFDVELDHVTAGPTYTTIFSGSTTTSQFYIETGVKLEAGEYYRWRVKTTKTGFTDSDWSDYAYFYMDEFSIGAPVKPTPLYPLNNAVVYTGNPTLHWYITSHIPGVEWDVQVQGVSVVYDETFTSNSYQYYFEWPTALTAGEDYQWRVRSKRSGYADSEWSDWAQFSVYEYANGVPVEPTPVWPVGNATVYLNPPMLHWYVTPYVPNIEYEVEVKEFSVPFDETGTFLTNSYQQFYQLVGNLTPGGHYHWRVRSFVGANFSSWSDPAEFTIDANNAIGSLPQPVLVYPTGVTVFTTQPILSWYVSSLASVTSFRLRVATDPAMINEIPGSPFTTTTMHYAFASSLTPGTTYYWTVESSNGIAFSTISAIGEFTIEPGSSPVVPHIGGPNGFALTTNSAKLNWYLPAKSTSQLKYQLEYATNKDFAGAVVVNNIDNMNYTIDNLQADTKYYWRVKSINNQNQSSGYSFKGSFRTSGVTSAEENIVIPDKFSVEQNYPNPFNPITTIRFNLPQASYVSIKIYNMLGQEVKTLLNSEMNPGVHTVQWNGDNNAGQKVSSGTYTYRVVAGDNVQTMKMVLMK